jgi:hypothetical protein
MSGRNGTTVKATPIQRLYDTQVAQLWELTKDTARGTLITFEEIAAAIDFPKESAPYRTIVARWRKMMLSQRGIFIRAATPYGVGYRLLMPDEQLYNQSERIEKHLGKTRRKLLATVGSISQGELDDKGRRFQFTMSTLYAAEQSLSKEHQARRQGYLSNPETMPRLPAPARTQ